MESIDNLKVWTFVHEQEEVETGSDLAQDGTDHVKQLKKTLKS